MRVCRILFCLVTLLLSVGCVYAYWLVNDRAAERLGLLSAESLSVSGDPARGEYIAAIGGCVACHTNSDDGGKPLAGGLPVKTPFGTFYSPNITSDKTLGIGNWSMDDFMKAMTAGLSPNGEHYYPAFPYTSYSTMSVQDLVDLKAWLDTVDPVTAENTLHDVQWPVSNRGALLIWKAIYFDPLRSFDNNDRGNYLVNGPGHCGECHSPRQLSGGISDHSLSGNSNGPDGEPVPGITSIDLADWVAEDLELFLEVGMTPSGDFTGGHMADVIEYSTGQLTPDDRVAITKYLLSKRNN